MTICKTCGRNYEYDRKRGHTKTKCNSCMVNMQRIRLKYKMVNYKGGRCQLCGYDKCLPALCFHHIDPTKKDFIISGNHARSWDLLKKELDKCILLCCNCHTEQHHLN